LDQAYQLYRSVVAKAAPTANWPPPALADREEAAVEMGPPVRPAGQEQVGKVIREVLFLRSAVGSQPREAAVLAVLAVPSTPSPPPPAQEVVEYIRLLQEYLLAEQAADQGQPCAMVKPRQQQPKVVAKAAPPQLPELPELHSPVEVVVAAVTAMDLVLAVVE
jgi:hypothetical protein